MAETQDRVHFYMSMKSIMDLPPEGPVEAPPTMSIYDKVRPRGDFYFINPNITLREDDWVIYGVASTDNVDLQNETIDAREVFGDYLAEFVNVGKIFYEHGYRYAKDASPTNRIDEPIGYPYMVEIFENKLWIWAVLDKEHPLAQKVWESLSNSDERFRNKWGFSIGGILVGKPQTSTTSLYGRVTQLPKMRLYEISVTPQPVNPYTWTQVVKSLVSEDSMDHKDDAEKKLEKETVDVKPGDQNEVTNAEKVEFGGEGAEGSPPAERKEGEDIVDVDVTKALEEEDVKEEEKVVEKDDEAGGDALEEALEKAASAEGEAQPEEGGEEVAAPEGEAAAEDVAEIQSDEQAEMTPEAEKGAKEEMVAEEGEGGEGDDDSVLVDLLGEGGEEESAEEGGDASIELILDEIASLREAFDELSSRMSKMLEMEAQEHADETLEEEGASEPEGPKVAEEVLTKSLAPLLDTIDFLREEVAAQKSLLIAAMEKLEAQEAAMKSISTANEPSVAEEALEARKNFDPNATVQKSVGDTEVEVDVPEDGTSDEVVKALGDTVADALNDTTNKSKFAKIIEDPQLLDAAESLVESYKSLNASLEQNKIRRSTYRMRTAEVFQIAKSVLGLDRKEFLSLVNEG